jgi:hypothetical protein
MSMCGVGPGCQAAYRHLHGLPPERMPCVLRSARFLQRPKLKSFRCSEVNCGIRRDGRNVAWPQDQGLADRRLGALDLRVGRTHERPGLVPADLHCARHRRRVPHLRALRQPGVLVPARRCSNTCVDARSLMRVHRLVSLELLTREGCVSTVGTVSLMLRCPEVCLQSGNSMVEA